MGVFRIWVFILLGFAILASSVYASDDWQTWTKVDVPENPTQTHSLTLHPKWKLDFGPDSELVVGRLVDVCAGINGNTLLLDGQLNQVLVVSPQGKVELMFGQKGQGPGDIPGAFRIIQKPTGEIGVCGGAPAYTVQIGGTGKTLWFTPEGLPAGVLEGPSVDSSMPLYSIRDLRCAGGNILLSGQDMKFSQAGAVRTQELALLREGTTKWTICASREIEEDMASPVVEESEYFEAFAFGRCDVSETGSVAFAPLRDSWLVVVSRENASGYCLQRPANQLKRTALEIQEIQKQLGGTEDCKALATKPVIGRVRWRPNGNLWVETVGAGPDKEALACFEEFGPDGVYFGRVQVHVPGSELGDKLHILENGNYVLLRGYSSELQDKEGNTGEAEAWLLGSE